MTSISTKINFQEKSTEFIREYIIVNDGSTLESYQRLQALAKENQIEIQIKNLGTRIGLIQARNLGAKFASGRVSWFLLNWDGLNSANNGYSTSLRKIFAVLWRTYHSRTWCNSKSCSSSQKQSKTHHFSNNWYVRHHFTIHFRPFVPRFRNSWKLYFN